jgi:O-antigen/teichoic acid export membrane protein
MTVMPARLRKISPTSWVTAQNLFKQVFAIALFAIQAPMLGPRAFGLIALVMVFIGFCEYVLEIAATDALISVKDIDEHHYATMTTVNVVFGLALGGLIFAFAPRIAASFREPELTSILRFMAALPIFTVLASAPNAACRRDLQFEPLVTRVLASTAIAGIVGLTLTFMHYGVWALVWQATIQRVLSIAILWKLVKMPFRMGFSMPHFQQLRRYAAPMMLSQTMSWAGDQVPRYILGFFLGASELGLFSLAARLCDIVLQLAVSPRYAVARIEMRQFADERAGIEAAMQRILTQMSALTFPLCIAGAVLMPLLFATWLNARWAGGVLPAQLMMLGIIPYVTHYALSAALLGMNRQSSIAINATAQTATLLLVSAVFAPLGLYPATAAIACRPLLTATIPIAFARRYGGIAAKGVLLAQTPALLAAGATGALLLGLRWVLSPYLGSLVLLVGLTLVGVASYSALVRLWLPEFAAEIAARLPVLRRYQRG